MLKHSRLPGLALHKLTFSILKLVSLPLPLGWKWKVANALAYYGPESIHSRKNVLYSSQKTLL